MSIVVLDFVWLSSWMMSWLRCTSWQIAEANNVALVDCCLQGGNRSSKRGVINRRIKRHMRDLVMVEHCLLGLRQSRGKPLDKGVHLNCLWMACTECITHKGKNSQFLFAQHRHPTTECIYSRTRLTDLDNNPQAAQMTHIAINHRPA